METNEFNIEQFEKSLNKYRKKEIDANETNINFLFCGFENELEKHFYENRLWEIEADSEFETKKDLSILILKSTYLISLEEKHRSIYFMLGCLKSPIEKAMLSALMIIGYDFARTVTAKYFDNSENPIQHEAGDFFHECDSNILIQPQFKIDKYKVDFLLTYKNKNKENKLIIECDGHDFHEKTKAQVEKDKKRERFLQDSGYKIHRYSGSEIYKDVFDSAYQALIGLSKIK